MSKTTDTRFPRFTAALLALALGALATPALGQGKAGFVASWLEVPVEARAAAMGEAYTGVAAGGAGLIYNPGGIAADRSKRFTGAYRVMRLDRTLSYAALYLPLREEATAALSWRFADYGDAEVRNGPGDPDGTIGQSESLLSLSFAKMFSKRVAVGATGSYYLFDLDDISANTVIFDAGVMFYVDHFLYDRETIGQSFLTDIQVGVVVKSPGSSLIIDTDKGFPGENNGISFETEVPKKLVIGGSARAYDKALLVAADLEIHEELGARGHFGAEYQVAKQLQLRAGLNRTAPTAGAGFLFELGKRRLMIDYAFQFDRVDEGSEHVFTLDFTF